MITIEEWKKHFLSVCEIMGEYECEFWNIVRFNDHWKIIGKGVGYKYHSLLNKNKVEYTDIDIILGDLFMLEKQIKILLRPKNHWIPEDCPEVPWAVANIDNIVNDVDVA